MEWEEDSSPFSWSFFWFGASLCLPESIWFSVLFVDIFAGTHPLSREVPPPPPRPPLRVPHFPGSCVPGRKKPGYSCLQTLFNQFFASWHFWDVLGCLYYLDFLLTTPTYPSFILKMFFFLSVFALFKFYRYGRNWDLEQNNLHRASDLSGLGVR